MPYYESSTADLDVDSGSAARFSDGWHLHKHLVAGERAPNPPWEVMGSMPLWTDIAFLGMR